MKKYILTLLLLSGFGAVSQISQPNRSVEEVKSASMSKAMIKAKKDIKNNSVSLFLQGGIAPITTNSDREFGKKFRVEIVEYGCVGLDRSFSVAYNAEIFKYLDQKFGKLWRNEIRNDIIGFTDYVAANR